jgi:hypothetical protein
MRKSIDADEMYSRACATVCLAHREAGDLPQSPRVACRATRLTTPHAMRFTAAAATDSLRNSSLSSHRQEKVF